MKPHLCIYFSKIYTDEATLIDDHYNAILIALLLLLLRGRRRLRVLFLLHFPSSPPHRQLPPPGKSWPCQLAIGVNKTNRNNSPFLSLTMSFLAWRSSAHPCSGILRLRQREGRSHVALPRAVPHLVCQYPRLRLSAGSVSSPSTSKARQKVYKPISP